MAEWKHEYDNHGTMVASTKENGADMVVTRHPLFAHQLRPNELGVVVRKEGRVVGGKVDTDVFVGNGKPISANEQAFDAGKELARELLKQFSSDQRVPRKTS